MFRSLSRKEPHHFGGTELEPQRDVVTNYNSLLQFIR
jgi:hypothetical protein